MPTASLLSTDQEVYPPAPPSPNPLTLTHYVLAVIVLVLISGVAYLVVVASRPDWDKLLVTGTILSVLTTNTWALFGFMKGIQAHEQSRQTYFQVNHRLDEFRRDLERRAQVLIQNSYISGEESERARGNQAATGPAGPIGLTGPTGLAGAIGETGPAGPASQAQPAPVAIVESIPLEVTQGEHKNS
jgi:hypothetical protein